MTIIKPSYRSEDLIKMRNEAIENFGRNKFHRNFTLFFLFRALFLVISSCLFSYAAVTLWQWEIYSGAVLVAVLSFLTLSNTFLNLTKGLEDFLLPRSLPVFKKDGSNPLLFPLGFCAAVKELSSLETFLSYLDQHPDCSIKMDHRYLTAYCPNDKTVDSARFYLSFDFGIPVLTSDKLDCSYLDKAIKAFLGGNDEQAENWTGEHTEDGIPNYCRKQESHGLAYIGDLFRWLFVFLLLGLILYLV